VDGPSPNELDLGVTVRGFHAGDKVFERYSLVRILGRGGMGVVWLARDSELDRDVALKFLPEMVSFDDQAVADLKRETRRSQELRHHHIVQVYDFVRDRQTACIAMEYVDGSTLAAVKAGKECHCLEVHEIKEWVEQLCEALTYAHHRAKVVHRDLKPSNLMVSGKGELKVADFGIARSVSDSMSMLTQVRGTSGTLLYMSPQQLDGERASHLDDIYSLGATLYELLTGKPPFYSGGVESQIREKTPAPIGRRRAELEVSSNIPVPQEWEETIAACLAKEPARRPQSAAEVARHLGLREHFAPVMPVVASPVLPPTPQPIAPKEEKAWAGRNATVTATVGTLFLSALLGLGWWGIQRARQEPEQRQAATKAEESTEAVREKAVAAEDTTAAAAKAKEKAIADEEARRRREAGELLSAAQSFLTDGKLDEAEAHAREALAKVASYPGAGAVLREVEEARKNREAAQAASKQAQENRMDWRTSIERFIRGYVAANQSKDAEATLACFAATVDYFDEGRRDQSYIARDFNTYTARWPTRRDSIEGAVLLEEKIPNREYAGHFKLNFYVESAARREWIKGQFAIDLTIALIDGTPKIIGLKEKVLRREKGKL